MLKIGIYLLRLIITSKTINLLSQAQAIPISETDFRSVKNCVLPCFVHWLSRCPGAPPIGRVNSPKCNSYLCLANDRPKLEPHKWPILQAACRIMMEDDTVHVDYVNKDVVEENSGRIERLFGARLRISDNGNGQCSCQILCQSDNAPEVLVKTKNYINALTAEGAGFSITTERYNLHQVNMILQNKDDIERQSTTIILASPLSNNVRLQGQLQDILLAKNIIQTLLTQNPATAPKKDTKHISEKNKRIEPSHQSADSGEERTMLQTERINSGRDEVWMTDKYVQEHLCNLGINTSVSQFKQSAESDSSDSSDDEENYEDIQQQLDYKNKVEFAFKLGYQEGDLLQALRKVGTQASQNELLSELIKQGASKGEAEGSGSDGSPLLSPEIETDMLDFGIQQRRNNLDQSSNLRHIIIDGSNVAMSHGNKEVFSCMGIKLTVDWFRNRGHTDITVFVPQWRKETSRTDAKIKDQSILNQLEKEKILVFTPARRIGGKRVVCYDDRYILKLAVETDGIVVSNDNYRDLIREKEEFKKVIEERLLMYSFVNDRFMPPDDPLGRNGPTLDNFLLIQPLEPEPLPPPCPYGSKKCTYGNKCKYYHPERKNQPHKTVTEKLAEQANLARQRMHERERSTQHATADGKKKLVRKAGLTRTTSLNTSELNKQNMLGNLQEPLSGSVSNLNKDDEYNQRLTESLRKMEQEHAMKDPHILRDQTKSPDRKAEVRSRGSEYSERQSSPRWTGIDNFKPGMVSPREASPVNLAVPGHGTNLDGGEQFVCGHLLLAKKLSDEATESDKLKNIEKRQDAGRHSPASGQQFQRIGGLSHSPDSKKSKPKQTVMKQKLSRQLSLQGSEDPRLRQGHNSLRAQYSYDPRLAPNTMYKADNYNESNLLKDFMSCQSFDGQRDTAVSSVPNVTQPGMFGAIGQALPSQFPTDVPKSHAPLSRMQSAPIPHPSQIFQQPQRPVPLMMRQNSSSDTQLNKIDISENIGYPPDRSGSHGYYGEALQSRGSVPSREKSGPASFQIGGAAPPSRPPLQHYSSMNALNQAFMLGSNDQDYMFHRPQYLSQTYSDIPQSRMPFMQGNHGNSMMQQASPNYGHHRASPSFLPSQPVHNQSQLIDQSGIWQNKQFDTASTAPSTMTSLNMPPSGMPPQSMSPRSQTNLHPLIQQQFSVPIPEDRPISDNDPRYKLYFHLCGLFPEEKVRIVMNQHPETTNASDICAYIIGTS